MNESYQNKVELIGKYYRVLDKGYVGLIDCMGDDSSILQAARTSYGKGTKKSSDDRTLIRYLLRHRHTTPFEMCELKFHVKVPMDCWRQWIRHRTASVNEYSTRYSEAVDEIATTDYDKWRLQAENNKQGSSGFISDKNIPLGYFEKDLLNDFDSIGHYLTFNEEQLHKFSKSVYNERLRFGVAREQARKDLPLSNYTIAYWKINLHNLFHFLKLRCDSHAQFEIREYANIIAGFVKELYPIAFDAWYDYSFQSIIFTRLDRQYLNSLVCRFGAINQFDETLKECKEKDNDYAYNLGMSKRELIEFWQKLDTPTFQDFLLPENKVLNNI